MKRAWPILLLLLATATAARAAMDLGTPAAVFDEAKRHYDEGRFADAAAAYTRILDDGWTGAELHFNRANALYRDGRVGEAIAGYLAAQREAPRDPDIEANLRLALQNSSAIEPRPRTWERLLDRVTRREATVALSGGYWALALVGIAYVWARNARVLCARLSGLALVPLLVGTAALLRAEWRERHPAAVAVRPGIEALFAPVAGSTAHFPMPEGSVGILQERQDRWVKVRVAGKEGWVPADTVAIVDG